MIQGASKSASSTQIDIINYFSQHKNELSGIGNLLKPNELINMNFFGLQLGIKSSYHIADLFGIYVGTYLPLLIIPILAVVTTFISTKISMKQATKKSIKVKGEKSIQNTMMYVGPLFT